MYRSLPLATGLVLLMSPAFGASSPSPPPAPVETTLVCPEGYVLDTSTELCVVIQDSNLQLDTDRLLEAARELAHAERYDDAITLLNASLEPENTMVLTYLGYAHRRDGRVDVGLAYYDRALAVDPDNLLARSYLGMAHVIAGKPDLARDQLVEIWARGGEGGWPEEALARAIAAGTAQGLDY